MARAEVILTGTTKCIGRWVLEEFLSRGIAFDCLARSSSDTRGLRARGLEVVEGDLNQPGPLSHILRGYKKVVHIPNLASMNAMEALVCAYEDAGIQRAIFISSTGIFTNLEVRTKPLRLRAEEVIMSSKLDFTILRPTLVYGDPEDHNISRLLRFCKRFPVIPIFGSGHALQQPIHLGDLAWAVAETIGNARTQRRAYNLGGGQVLSYNDLVHLAYRALGKRGVLLHVPSQPVALVARAANTLGLRLPLREEQIRRLEEDKAYDISPAREDFGFAPRPFEVGLVQEVRLMKSLERTGL